VVTHLTEEHTRVAAIIETTLKLAGERDPEVLLQGVSHLARQIIPAQYASVGILSVDGQEISGRVFSSGMDAGAVTPAIPVLRPDVLANWLVARRALRLRDVSSESLGFELLPGAQHLSSVLGVPLSGPLRVRGFLLLANKLHADEFSDRDEQVAVAFASQVTMVYEKLEEQRRADEELCESKAVLEAMFESAPDAIAAVDERGRNVRVNAQTKHFSATPKTSWLGSW
jgi:GAF domain-containing protein